LKLRGKLFSILGISYLFISIGIIITSNSILINGFVEQENEDILEELEIGANSLELRLEALEHRAIELGNNDNVYTYMQSGLEHLVNDFLLSSSFMDNKISFLVFKDINGDIVLGKGFDHIKLRNMELDESIEEILESDVLLDLETVNTGLVVTENGLVMISTSPILTTDGKGPALGITICGRILDPMEVYRLSETTSVNLQLVENNDAIADGELTGSAYYVTRPKYDTITAFKAIKDMNGVESIALVVQSDRDYFNQAVIMLAYFVGASVLSGLIIGLIAIIATNRYILEKIIKLSEEVNSIDPRALDERRVEIKGDDEISELSLDIDRMLELLEEYQRLLKEKERMATIGETAAMVGHDLRNPLQVVIMLGSRLSKISSRLGSLGIEDKAVNELNIIEGKLRDQVGYMNKIVSDLQDYSRNIRLVPAYSDFKGMIVDILETMQVPETISVESNLDETLGNVYADENYLRRVFNNLINNAIQAMPNGGKLTVSGSIEDKTVHFSVGDTGMGIKKEDMDSIFRPLFTTKAKGTGLGLAVCKRVVTAHGGKIWFESELGVGTTFHIEFPENTSDSIESIATAETAGEIVEVN
jgi:signal transduction histidine kinase